MESLSTHAKIYLHLWEAVDELPWKHLLVVHVAYKISNKKR